MKYLVWLPSRLEGKRRVSVGGVRLGYTRDDAVTVSETQLSRLQDLDIADDLLSESVSTPNQSRGPSKKDALATNKEK